MSKLIYIDTNVWIDYLQNRADYLRPLGQFAFRLLQKTLECKYRVILSDWTLEELSEHARDFQDIIDQFKEKRKVIFVRTASKDIRQTKQGKHWEDRLHALLVAKASASYLVTRNLSDFVDDWYPFEVKLPESL
jgi:predicted nucleic acid-binding protein